MTRLLTITGFRAVPARVDAGGFPRRSNAQASITISTVGDETLQIGNHDLVATHLRATVSGGEVHDIWVDKSGRLLKVALPSRALVAVRDDPPPA
jgi:hypothetical protein